MEWASKHGSGDQSQASQARSYTLATTPGGAIMSAADTLLPRLEKVKSTGPDQWLACCPAHADRTPSLSIKQADDRLLLHCFAGCPAGDVVAAVGLSLADLFDKTLEHARKPLRRHERQRIAQAADALRAIDHESLIVLVAADRLAGGWGISGDDLQRLHLANQRIRSAHHVVFGQPLMSQDRTGRFLRTLKTDLDRDCAAVERQEVAA